MSRHRYHVRVFQVSHNVNMLDQYLAHDFGFYAAQGLEVEPVIGFDFSGFRLSDPVALLADGDVDFAVAGSLVFAAAAQRGLALRHLLVTRLDPPHWFLVRPTSSGRRIFAASAWVSAPAWRFSTTWCAAGCASTASTRTAMCSSWTRRCRARRVCT